MAAPIPPGPIELSTDEQLDVLKTWRYLRLAMAGLAITIFAAIVEDFIHGHVPVPSGKVAHCFQGSISAYYYTPVHGLLVGALVAIGICLYCLRGDTSVEDALLNIAGMCAPVVAFVPTDPPGRCVSAAVSLDRFGIAGTSMFSLAFLETLALVVVFVLSRKPHEVHVSGLTPADKIGYVSAVGIVVLEWVLWVLFLNGHEVYTKVVHFSSAILMFVCIFVVVWVRAAAKSGSHKFWHFKDPNLDSWITLLMAVSVVAFVILKAFVHWRYAIFQIEFCLIALFIVYWIDQTIRGWHPGFGESKGTPPELIRSLSGLQ
jgi:hypothetical protein